VNKDIYVPAENAYKGAVYSPFTVYYYAQLQAQIAKINNGQTTGSQAADKRAAAEVAKGLYADDASLTDGWQTQTIFPLNQNVLKSDAFVNAKVGFFGGQTANKDVYIPAENAYQGFTYSPFTVYYYAQLQAQIAKIGQGRTTGAQAATDLQQIIVKYAQSQGFKVR
jgi:multiple sugar transport system substrate-binding protein